MSREKLATRMGDLETVCAKNCDEVGNIRVIKYAHTKQHTAQKLRFFLIIRDIYIF